MIVTCQNCAARLRLDDAKAPARPFTVRCPKCQQIINAQPPAAAGQRDALSAVTDLPASTRAQLGTSGAPTAHAARDGGATDETGGDLLRALAALLGQHSGEGGAEGASRGGGRERRRVLACVGPDCREPVAAALAGGCFAVSVAEGAAQAAERLRGDCAEVVVLEARFDPAARGAASVAGLINSLRMAERRRLAFVLISERWRTGDAHAAFVENANLVVNTADVRGLAAALENNLRDLNDLYRDFNKALNLAPL